MVDSGAGVEAADASGVGVEATSADDGVMTLSTGSMVADVSKRDGYISPGVDKNDSVGEVSNLTAGVDETAT